MQRTLYIVQSAVQEDSITRAAAVSDGVVLDCLAIPIRRLVEDIAKSSPSSRLISPAGRRMLLRDIVKRHGPEDRRDMPGYRDAIDTVISDLKESLVDSLTLDASLPKGNRSLQETVEIYGEYQRALDEHGLGDGHDVAAVALEVLASGELPEVLAGVSSVVFDGIYRFTPAQFSVVIALSRMLPVTVRFPYDFERDDLFAYVSTSVAMFEALDNSALDLNIEFQEFEEGKFSPLLKRMFSKECDEEIVCVDSLAAFSAPGAYQECEEIGRRVRRLLESGAEAARIAVGCRDLRVHGDMLLDVFRRYRIPVSMRRGRPLGSSAVVTAILSPYDCLASRLSTATLSGIARSSYVSGSYGASSSEVSALLVEAGYIDLSSGDPVAVVEQHLRNMTSAGREPGWRAAALEVLVEIVADVRSLGGERTTAAHVEALATFIEKRSIFRTASSSEDIRTLRRDVSAITLLRKVLSNITDDAAAIGLADASIDSSEFIELVWLSMRGEHISGDRDQGVSVVSFADLQGVSYEHVFLAALNDDICPRRHDPHPLIKDADRIAINRALGMRLFRTSAENSLEEPLLFYLAIASATESVTLSCSHMDTRGSHMLRSPFLDEIASVTDLVDERIPVGLIVPPLAECMDMDELTNCSAKTGAIHSPHFMGLAEIVAPSSAPILRSIVHKGDVEQERAAYLESGKVVAGRFCGLAGTSGGTLFSVIRGGVLSPTGIEKYAGCPFRYLAEDLLGVRTRMRLTHEPEPSVQGSVAHYALESVYGELKKQGLLPLRGLPSERVAASSALASCRESAMRMLGAVKQQWKDNFLLRLEKLVLLVMMRESLGDPCFVPEAFEDKIDGTEFAGVYWRGQIDRVDVNRKDGIVRVCDYKYSADVAGYESIMGEDKAGVSSFKMPVYAALAALRRKLDPRLALSSVWVLKKAEIVDAKPLGDAYDTLVEAIGSHVASMRCGDYIPSRSGCDRCSLAPMCRASSGAR